MLTSDYQLNPFRNNRTAIWSGANVYSGVRHMNIWDNQKSSSVIKSSVSWQITTFLAPLHCHRYLNTNISIYLTFMGPRITNVFSSITNKMHRYTIHLFLWGALHVSGGSSAHHQELKTVYTASGTLSNLYCDLTLSWQVAVKVLQCTECCIHSFELLIMGRGTAWNM